MSTPSYNEVLEKARSLPLEEQIQLVKDILRSLRETFATDPQRLHSIIELEGLGKELWEGVDVDKYIEEERNSWEKDSRESGPDE